MADGQRLRPIGEVLPGIEILELPEGWVPLEVIVCVKGLDSDGDPLWASRYTKGVSTAEAIGALVGMSDLERARFVSMYEPDD